MSLLLQPHRLVLLGLSDHILVTLLTVFERLLIVDHLDLNVHTASRYLLVIGHFGRVLHELTVYSFRIEPYAALL